MSPGVTQPAGLPQVSMQPGLLLGWHTGRLFESESRQHVCPFGQSDVTTQSTPCDAALEAPLEAPLDAAPDPVLDDVVDAALEAVLDPVFEP
jgi:hypothetical protein